MSPRSKSLVALPLLFLMPGSGLVYLGQALLGSAFAIAMLVFAFAGVFLPTLFEPAVGAWVYDALFVAVILIWIVQAALTVVAVVRIYRGDGTFESHLPLAIALVVFCTALSMAVTNLRAKYGLIPFVIPTASMKPTLLPGDRILVRAWPEGTTGEAFRGQVVVHQMSVGKDSSPTIFVKRVVAVGGDAVTIDEACGVLVNGKAVPPPGPSGDPASAPACPPEKLTLAPKTLFLLGDNRENSEDSRQHGAVEESAVIGRPFAIWFSRLEGGIRWDRIGLAVK